jgi:hypothetical protein
MLKKILLAMRLLANQYNVLHFLIYPNQIKLEEYLVLEYAPFPIYNKVILSNFIFIKFIKI